MHRRDLRFTIAGMMLVMLICSVIAAAAGFLWRAWKSGSDTSLLFFGFVLLGPFAVMIIVSLLRAGLIWVNRSSASKRKKT